MLLVPQIHAAQANLVTLAVTEGSGAFQALCESHTDFGKVQFRTRFTGTLALLHGWLHSTPVGQSKTIYVCKHPLAGDLVLLRLCDWDWIHS